MFPFRFLLFLPISFLVALAADAKTFIVFPFESRAGDPALEWIGEGVALSLGEGLRHAGLRVVSREERVRLVEMADLPPAMPLSRASMIRVAQQASADFLVFGWYSGSAASLQVSLQVLDLEQMRLGGTITANGPLSSLRQMENDLSWLVLANNDLAPGYTREEHQKAVRAVPNPPYALYIESLTAPDEDTAVAALAKAVALYPQFAEAHFLLGRYYFQEGKCTEALAHLAKAPAGAEARFMSGNCRLVKGQLDEAIGQYRALFEAMPVVEAASNLGVACLRKGDYEAAGEYLEKARAMAPADATVGLNLAVLRYLEGKLEAALEVIEGSLKEHPSHGMLRYLRGLVLAKMGRGAESDDALEVSKRLGIDPEELRRQDPRLWTRVFQTWKHR
jgi:tetratricopeptide (TPR) repeat protein